MPTSLHITILDGGGPMAGRSLALNTSPIRFGRDLSCDVVLDATMISRLHGQFERDDAGQWSLTCFSGNGLKIGRKALEQNESIAITGATIVNCGKTKLLQIQPFETAADQTNAQTATAESQTQAEAVSPADAANKKRKLIWTGVGLWIGLLLIVGIVLASLPEAGENKAGLPPAMTAEQIAVELNKPPTQGPRDTTLAQIRLNEANQFFENIDSQQDALARAYWAYHEALQHTEDGVFNNGLDQRRFQHARTKLQEQIVLVYDDAYALVQSRDWGRAIDYLDELNKLYPAGETDSELIIHMRRLKAYCRSQGKP